MQKEDADFQKIVDSLSSLTEAEQLHLEEVVWKLKPGINKGDAPSGSFESATVVFFKQKTSENVLSTAEIEKALGNCNPAEINALHTLIIFHLDKTHDHEGQSVSASWNNKGGFRSGGEVIGINRKPDATPSASVADSGNNADAVMHLLREAEAAQEAGNREQAQALVEEAIQIAENFGLPSTMLQRLRDQYS